FLRALVPGVECAAIRGNVDTRLRKVRDGEFDATVLAAAGLRRLGIAFADAEAMPLDTWPPAPGQGALAVQMRSDHPLPTRRREDNGPLAERLRGEGVDVIELPCLKTQPLADVSALAAAIGRLRPDDWLVVTSRPGADAVARAARPAPRVAAIGRATAARLADHGIAVSFKPRVPSGAALARELPPGNV